MLENSMKKFYQTLDEMGNPADCFLCTNLEDFSYKPTLQYARENFINDIKNILEDLPQDEQKSYTLSFGFELFEKDEHTILSGFPTLENIKTELNNLNTIQTQIYKYVEQFVYKNSITIKNYKSHEKFLNVIIKTFPQWITLIGKIQHKTHSYSVDVHTLNVLQKTMNDDEYKKLPINDQHALQIAILMHDITKKEGEIDKTHPTCAAQVTKNILKNMPIKEKEQAKICLLIKNHDWLERYNKNLTSAEEFAQILKEENNFKMLCILAKADLLSVQCNGKFYEKYEKVLADGAKVISNLINSNEAA